MAPQMQFRQRGQRALRSVERWSMEGLEKIALKCKLISSARSTEDWELFLRSLYEAVTTLTNLQRAILILSQEYGILRREISRIFGLDNAMVHKQYVLAVQKVTQYMLSRNLLAPLGEAMPIIHQIRGFKSYADPARYEEVIDGDLALSRAWAKGVQSPDGRTGFELHRIGEAEGGTAQADSAAEGRNRIYLLLPKKSAQSRFVRIQTEE